MNEFEQPGIPRSTTLQMMSVKRYGVSARLKQNALDYIERTIEDPMAPDGSKMKAIECMLKMDMIDLAMQKDDAAATAATAAAPAMVLLLPPNGTEYNIDR